MARQRRGVEKGNPERNHQAPASRDWKPLRAGITVVCMVVAASVSFIGYLETRVNSRFDKEKMVELSGLELPERYWGSYRPGLYFGMKTRDPHSAVAGLMWYFPKKLGPDGSGIRHWCEQGDNLEYYSWTEHDGRNFGVQRIADGSHVLETSFVKRAGGKHGGDWTARVVVSGGNASLHDEIALIFYFALDDKSDGWIGTRRKSEPLPGIVGRTSGLGGFALSLVNRSGEIVGISHLSTVAPGLHVLKDALVGNLRVVTERKTGRRRFVLPGEVLRSADGTKSEPNFVAIQITAKVAHVDVALLFESESFANRPNALAGEAYEKALEKHRAKFDEKFEKVFRLTEKGYGEGAVAFAKSALSNLIGGIGYFYGTSRVQSAHTKHPVPYWKAPLYTGVPSRSFFPRGFLWDEGFHGLLLSAWDLDIEIDIMEHWFDLMNVEGWIPREQILGQEALAKVPEEFVTQHNTNANPPAFFLTLRFVLARYGDLFDKEDGARFLEKLYPRLQAWFDWFNVTQSGKLPGTYRWRGRDPDAKRELNPKTLTSGLDDYPRASHPSDDERHLDLRCWIALAASTLSDVSRVLGRNGVGYEHTYSYLTDPELLRRVHWSERTQRFADYGLHTDAVSLKRPPPSECPSGRPQPNPEMMRVATKSPTHRFVDSTFGYVSLFPFLLEQLDKNAPELGAVLKDIEDPQLLWTQFGLRSLSKTSPLYKKYNTEHDPPYWRGPIWINLNYLAVKALHHYSRDGVHSAKAADLYNRLRNNLILNMYKEYVRTGYVWEQYDDETGHGQGSRPFTGWSSLVVLLMGEIY